VRCSKCNDSCGDDHKTRTKYREEKNAGDRGKVILLQIYDWVHVDNLQVAEVKALLNTLVDEHIQEVDHNEK
jgi:hypothetical protein